MHDKLQEKFSNLRNDFPILKRRINGKSLVYLDNAATTQKPKQVIEAIVGYYENHNANVHRGVHTLSDESTTIFEASRDKIARFLGTKNKNLILVRNTTEAINTVAYAWARKNLNEDSVIICSELEHHSNMVPWQEVAKDSGAKLTFVDVTSDGVIDVDHLEMILDSMGKDVGLIALSLLSNVTGALLPIERVIALKKKYAKNAKLVIDAAQAVAQMPIEFDNWGIDFLAFSGHKLYGPMGIGGLLVKDQLVDELGPFLSGGGMIEEVYLNGALFLEAPDRFEAGTPDVAGAVGLAAAVEYLSKFGMGEVRKHSGELVKYALERLGEIGRIRLIGPMENRMGSVAFIYEGVHAHDVAQVLSNEGVMVRSGHHCCMPLHTKFSWEATTRASFGIYNNKEDVERLVEGLEKVKEVFGS